MKELRFALVDDLSIKVNKSYKDPYDAFQYVSGSKLCLIQNKDILFVLPTKLISLEWAIACIEGFLGTIIPTLEVVEALTIAKKYLKNPNLNKNEISDINNIIKDTFSTRYSPFKSTLIRPLLYMIVGLDADNAFDASFITHYLIQQHNTDIKRFREIEWQRKKLSQIVEKYIAKLLLKYSHYTKINKKLIRKEKQLPKELYNKITEYF